MGVLAVEVVDTEAKSLPRHREQGLPAAAAAIAAALIDQALPAPAPNA